MANSIMTKLYGENKTGSKKENINLNQNDEEEEQDGHGVYFKGF